MIAPRLPVPGLPGLRLVLGRKLRHSYDAAPGALRRCSRYDRRGGRCEERSMAMTAIVRIARRVASVVDEMNYAQRRTLELFLGLDENRR